MAFVDEFPIFEISHDDFRGRRKESRDVSRRALTCGSYDFIKQREAGDGEYRNLCSLGTAFLTSAPGKFAIESLLRRKMKSCFSAAEVSPLRTISALLPKAHRLFSHFLMLKFNPLPSTTTCYCSHVRISAILR